MQWSRNDSWMVTADQGGYVKYWQSNMNNVKMFQAHKEPVRAIRWESSGDVYFNVITILSIPFAAIKFSTLLIIIMKIMIMIIIKSRQAISFNKMICDIGAKIKIIGIERLLFKSLIILISQCKFIANKIYLF